ncbi:hypothetical protein B0H10DRAFT_2436177 [Mycena sp. CBHHK59/15]|nr:hypothetical protein B0H10DRAFT_2436177 [Mycena sp. CBHHK59/15]
MDGGVYGARLLRVFGSSQISDIFISNICAWRGSAREGEDSEGGNAEKGGKEEEKERKREIGDRSKGRLVLFCAPAKTKRRRGESVVRGGFVSSPRTNRPPARLSLSTLYAFQPTPLSSAVPIARRSSLRSMQHVSPPAVGIARPEQDTALTAIRRASCWQPALAIPDKQRTCGRGAFLLYVSSFTPLASFLGPRSPPSPSAPPFALLVRCPLSAVSVFPLSTSPSLLARSFARPLPSRRVILPSAPRPSLTYPPRYITTAS